MGCGFLKPKLPLIGTSSYDSATHQGVPYYQLEESVVSEQEMSPRVESVPENNTSINNSLKEAKITIHPHPNRVQERKLRRAIEVSVNRKASSDELPPKSVRMHLDVKHVKTTLTPPINPRRQAKSNTLPASLSDQIYGILFKNNKNFPFFLFFLIAFAVVQQYKSFGK
jgi:hypothetical protein